MSAYDLRSSLLHHPFLVVDTLTHITKPFWYPALFVVGERHPLTDHSENVVACLKRPMSDMTQSVRGKGRVTEETDAMAAQAGITMENSRNQVLVRRSHC